MDEPSKFLEKKGVSRVWKRTKLFIKNKLHISVSKHMKKSTNKKETIKQ